MGCAAARLARSRFWVALVLALPSVLWAHETQSIRFARLDGAITSEVTGAVDLRTPFAIASVGKTMTAVAMLRLAERGMLGLDDLAAAHLPEEARRRVRGLDDVSIRHLLTMTSGLPDYYAQDYIDDALAAPDRERRPMDALDYIDGEPPLFAPGQDFDYTNTNYLLLGMILEYRTRQTYAEVISAEVFKPSGMTDSFAFGSRSLPGNMVTGHAGRAHVRNYYEGTGFGDGGVISSAGDLVRFYDALFKRRSLLSREMLSAMMRDPIGAGYGMGIEVEDGLVGHSGGDYGFAADVRMNLGTGDIALVLIGEEDADTDWAFDQLLDP